jgi:ketosteroid isomerase-like protein
MSDQSGPADIAVRFQDAWNAHDMAAFGRLFHADASFVNRFGSYWRRCRDRRRARADSCDDLQRFDAGERSRGHRLHLERGGDLAYLVAAKRRRSTSPGGPHRIDTLILAVATSPAGEWRIHALENVTLVDPKTGVPRLRT